MPGASCLCPNIKHSASGMQPPSAPASVSRWSESLPPATSRGVQVNSPRLRSSHAVGGLSQNAAPCLNASYRGEASKQAPADVTEGKADCVVGKAGETARVPSEIGAFFNLIFAPPPKAPKTPDVFRRFNGEF